MESSDKTIDSTDDPGAPSDSMDATSAVTRPLRIWPVVLLLMATWACRIFADYAGENSMNVFMTRFLAPLILSILVLLWWVLASRATIGEKLAGTVGLIVVVAATTFLSDKTVRGFGTALFAVPWGMSAFAVGAMLFRSSYRTRTFVALLGAILGFGYWTLVRTDEILGDFSTVQRWRWEPSSESKLLASIALRRDGESSDASNALGPLSESQWPAFRGADRRSEVSGVVLSEDWEAEPPKELWRIPVGPGWSSFSVAGERIFTQEQRGENEVTVCYNASDGSEVWVHADESRFWEFIGGAGPRGTPTIANGALYSLGANGLLSRLDPVSGELTWQVDMRDDADRDPPMWGFSSSPLVTHGVVIVHAGGEEEKGLLAYDEASGELRWGAPAGDHSYSSAQLSTVDGRECVLMLSNQGLVFIDPDTGALLGNHEWLFQGYRVVQPLMVDDSRLLIGTGMGEGTSLVNASWNGDSFTTEDEWTSNRMSPYFNDFVVHEGYLYGFDNNIFACVDLETGDRMWKRGRYGNGQVLLLPTAGQLLATTETGELVLMVADPDGHREVAKFEVLEGRTWNHPVLVGNRLFVRNAEEAACYELAVKD